ncbi:MAG: MBL fold metallo-hydrolase [Anaerolineaceae bacterium]|nr:MBL fold metallo-hydrolase [Anaerolineaceae bacterium]
MSQLELVTRQVGPWGMNTYALICPSSNQSVLIDPGDDPETLREMLGDSQPVAILLTHTHVDHIGALPEMRESLNVPVMGNDGPHEPGGKDIAADRWLRDGDTVSVGEHTLRAVYAPGHIGDQICFVLADDHRVIVGDTIFDGGPGRTWTSEGFKTTLETLRNVVLPWPDDTVCYPGHGPHFRLGDRRTEIEAFLAKDHGDFFGDATWDM